MKRPYLKLRHLYEDNGLNRKELSVQSGISPSTLSDRFKSPESNGTWRWKEITAICRVLHIPQEKIGEYFFPQVAKEDKTA